MFHLSMKCGVLEGAENVPFPLFTKGIFATGENKILDLSHF